MDHLGLEQAADSEDLACLSGHMLVILRQGLFLPTAHGGQGDDEHEALRSAAARVNSAVSGLTDR